MSFQKPEQVPESVGRARSYTWDKSWVRPYESPISIYMNFVMINAFSYSEVANLWGLQSKCYPDYRYDYKSGCYVNKNIKNIEEFMKPLIPDDYIWFPRLYCNIESPFFRYCPECIRQGYHSLISQNPVEIECPIHKIRYIARNIIPIGIKGRFDEYRQLLGTFPLPPEREDIAYNLIGERIEEFCQNDMVGLIMPSFEDKLYNKNYHGYISKLALSTDRKLIATFSPDHFDFDGFKDKIWRYYARSKVEFLNKEHELMNDGWVEDIENTLNYLLKRSNYCNNSDLDYLDRVIELACLLDFNNDTYKPIKYEKYRSGSYEPDSSACPSDDNSLISSSYCYAVRGNIFESEIFSEKYIFSPASSVAVYCKPTYNTFLAYIPGYVSKLHICYNDESLLEREEIEAVISCYIKYDHFWFQAKRYMDHIKSMKTFDFYNEWKNIDPLIYEIDCKKNGDLEIYRISV
jgi:hypothetical protein